MHNDYIKNTSELVISLLNNKYDTKEQFLNVIEETECLDYIESEDGIIVIPKVEKPIKVVFDYGKCPECGFDLVELGCLKCMNKEFIDSIE